MTRHHEELRPAIDKLISSTRADPATLQVFRPTSSRTSARNFWDLFVFLSPLFLGCPYKRRGQDSSATMSTSISMGQIKEEAPTHNQLGCPLWKWPPNAHTKYAHIDGAVIASTRFACFLNMSQSHNLRVTKETSSLHTHTHTHYTTYINKVTHLQNPVSPPPSIHIECCILCVFSPSSSGRLFLVCCCVRFVLSEPYYQQCVQRIPQCLCFLSWKSKKRKEKKKKRTNEFILGWDE